MTRHYLLYSSIFISDKSLPIPSDTSQNVDLNSPPSDPDLYRCSQYLSDDLTDLAGLLDVSDDELDQIKKRFKKINIQALQLLKTWRNNRKGSCQDLFGTLQCLGQSEAAEKYVIILN